MATKELTRREALKLSSAAAAGVAMAALPSALSGAPLGASALPIPT